MSKTPEDYFVDWEGYVFGHSYGSGEEFILPLVRQFLYLCQNMEKDSRNHVYDHTKLELELGHAVTWLLINALGHARIIDYGISPRYGWMTTEGRALRDFMLSKSPQELVELVVASPIKVRCTPSYCNCGPNGYEKGRVCDNPFWPKKG